MVNTRNGGGDANPPNIEEIVAQAVVAAIQNLCNERSDGAGSSNEGLHVWIERFNKLKPNPFLSATTPTEASDWIIHCEKLSQVIGCPDGVKARLAAFKFDGDALNWWTSYVQAKGDGFVETCTWAAFREAFYKRLASFVGPTMSGDAARQARHYKWGLKHWILDRIVNTDYADVSMVCDAACIIELLYEGGTSNKRTRDGERIQSGSSGSSGQYLRGFDHRGRSEQSVDHRGRSDRQHEYRRQFNRGHDQGRQGDKSGNTNQRQFSRGNQQNRYSGSRSSHQQYRSGNSSGQYRRAETLPTCLSCGKSHSGTCRTASGACYECGSTEHRVKDCPKKTNIVPSGSSQPSTSTGRVHSISREQAGNASG
ncbi:hypothetical protein CTI12_AA585860 [Artemisia annua]|uniref:CCHC-type domain-containing protein n=1 Tax=Artemisia annua TaxID=35608 RepID=A0A2U1KMM8_ARTAN|nr:hypothetical protein CTI12_AA585860 [Artemisia annua]